MGGLGEDEISHCNVSADASREEALVDPEGQAEGLGLAADFRAAYECQADIKTTLAQRLDLRDVLTDEPRDIRGMGRDHEMTRAGNGHQRRSGN